MTTALDLAQRLESARQTLGMTRQELTEKAGVSRQAVYRLLKGNDVQVSTLLAVTDVLGLDLVTIQQHLRRSLPDVGTPPLAVREPAPPPYTPLAEAAAASAPRALSAVQQRLAELKAGPSTPAAAPKDRP